jgi:hypothetical protein
MGQISGVNAQSITYIAGVPVASISYVGPISAATLGLGGGGLVFTVQFWGESLDACTNGAASISDNGSQTLYENEKVFYTDSSFENRFNGEGAWWWCQTNNTSYAIGGKGTVKDTLVCAVSTGKTFTNSTDWGEPAKACNDGPIYIGNGGETIVLYYKQEDNRMYTNSSFTEVFFGNGFYYWNQTDNQWWLISGEGYVEGIGNCG